MPISTKKVIPLKGPMAGKEIEVNKYWYSKNDKPLAVIFGCFSPFTGKGGHGRMLETAKRAGINDFVLVFPNKKETLDDDRNMFTLEQKLNIATKGIKELGYNLLDSFIAKKNFPYSCFKEVAEKFPNRRIVIVCGPDRIEEYSKFCKPYSPENEQEPGLEHDDFEYILNDPGKENIRGTAVRQAIKNNDEELFMSMTGYNKKMWDYLRNMALENGTINENAINDADVALNGVDKIIKTITDEINPNTNKPEQVFFVGGCVRDDFLGKTVSDYDLITTMEGIKLENLDLWDESTHFFRPGKVVILATLDGERYEINTCFPKLDDPKGLYANLESRDITINAIAKDAVTNRIYDPCNGKKDIAAKIIKATPFTIDKFNNGKEPVRVIRILRFLGYFGPGWKLSKETKDALMNYARVNKGKCKIPEGQFAQNWRKIKYDKDKIISLIKELGFHDYFMMSYPDYAADNKDIEENKKFHNFNNYVKGILD